jgi:hypothetical protein
VFSCLFYFYFSSYHPLLFATSRGVWCSYSWCLSTPYVEWNIKNLTETILTDHCRCRSQCCNDADIVDAACVQCLNSFGVKCRRQSMLLLCNA